MSGYAAGTRALGSVAEGIASALKRAGSTQLFASADTPLHGIPERIVADGSYLQLFASADGRVGCGPGVAWESTQRLTLSTGPGADIENIRVNSADTLNRALDRLCDPGCWTLALQFDLDLDSAFERSPNASPTGVEIDHDVPPEFILVGPGVIRGQAIESLRNFATRSGLGVTNTWGAKGVFNWQSEHHMGTAGLQAKDFDLLGLNAARAVMAAGTDAAELHGFRAPTVTIPPGSLSSVLAGWRFPTRKVESNEFMQRMSAVCMPLREKTSLPLSPGRAIVDLARGDRIFADPGVSGFWIARAFPTARVGSAVVPAYAIPGFAVAAAIAEKLRDPGAAVIAVTDAPLHPINAELIFEAKRLGIAFPLVVWDFSRQYDARYQRVEQLHELLERALQSEEVELIQIPIDADDSDALIEVAGPVVAWPELDLPSSLR